MREILFRGKTRDGLTWIEGNYEKLEICGDTIHRILPIEYDTYSGELVDAETVGQYTGLKDKNGKKIFEGDSLSITFRRRAEKPFEMHGTVIWEEETAAFSVEGFFDSSPQFLCDIVEDSEVIGNIHDNPELYNLV